MTAVAKHRRFGPTPALALTAGVAVALFLTLATLSAGRLWQQLSRTPCERQMAQLRDAGPSDVLAPELDSLLVNCAQAATARPDDPNLLYLYGKALTFIADYAAAGNYFRQAAGLDSAAARHELALMSLYGRGQPYDPGQAAGLLKLAAAAGYPPAQHQLGELYLSGEGVARDPARAAHWYRSAAEQDYAPARYSLGLAYRNGNGVAKNPERAIEQLRRAADQGHAKAQYALALEYYSGQIVAQEFALALDLMRRADEGGYGAAKRGFFGNALCSDIAL